MSAAPAGVVVVGELCADIVVQLAGDVRFGQAESIVPSTQITLGSSSAITACGLARLGVATELVSVRGDDLLGRFVHDELEARSVGTSGVRVDPSVPTGSSTILTKPDGDRAILTALGSIGQVRADDIPAPLLESAGHVHVGSYFLQYGLHETLADWYAAARATGLSTSLDPNDDPDQRWDCGIREVLRHTDVLFCNEEEAAGIAGTPDAARAVAVLLGLLPEDGQVVLKKGAEGAEVHSRSGLLARSEPPADGRPFVDAVGAGDSLSAGYLAARLRGLDPADALAVGVANGTASTRAVGGTPGQLAWDPTWDPRM